MCGISSILRGGLYVEDTIIGDAFDQSYLYTMILVQAAWTRDTGIKVS